MSSPELIKSALHHYQSGNLQEAERLFREFLEKQPDNPGVLYLLGTIYGHFGKYDPAIQYIKRSLQLNPANAEACCALGIALQQKGLPDEALDYFQQSVHLDPGNAEARKILGNALREKADAVKEKKRLDEAITCYQQAIGTDPNLPDADILFHNLAMCFQAKGLFDEAIRYYQQAVQVNPRLLAAYNNLGFVLQKRGRFDEAGASYQKALLIDPHSPETYYNLGVLLQGQGRHNEASDSYDVAIAYRPDYTAARWAKCIAQLPILYPDQSAIEISRERYREELMKLHQSVVLKTPGDIRAAVDAVGTQQPFHLPYQGFNDRDLQQLYGNLVCKIMSAGYPHLSIRPAMPPRVAGEPLRVGIVSACFCSHPVWKTIIRGWIENAAADKIRFYGYSTGQRRDNETDKAKRCFARFVENRYAFEDLCKTIVDDNLHAIIYPEIGMDPATIRLAALRLAPVQCVSWGHPDTSGLPTIDYYLSSALMEPPNGDDAYTEQLVRLPNLSIYYTPREGPDAAVNRDIFGLRPGSVLYHCCQALFKFLPQYDEIFPRIARLVGDCQFLFTTLPEIPAVVEQFRMRINRAFNRFNLNADDYVVFFPYLDQANYTALNRTCDVFLDPIGWSGCASTLEAIDGNLPVVAFPGPLMRGRESGAILTMMGLTETIAASVEEYVALAIQLGQDSEWRRQISEKIAGNKCSIYEDRTCIAALEDFLLTVVEQRL